MFTPIMRELTYDYGMYVTWLNLYKRTGDTGYLTVSNHYYNQWQTLIAQSMAGRPPVTITRWALRKQQRSRS